MLTFRPTPTGGIGQPLRPARPSRRSADDLDRAADMAAEEAERRSGDCAWDTADQCHAAQATYLEENGERWSWCRRHPIATHRLELLADGLEAEPPTTTPALSHPAGTLELLAS